MILVEGRALKLVGTPITELSKEINERQPDTIKFLNLKSVLY
jgi:hypothetical protein